MRIGGYQKTTLLDYPGTIAATVFTAGCNMRCPFCHNSDLFAPEELWTEEEIFEHLKTRAGMLEGVAITGGEPTLQKDLPEFIRKVRDLGYKVKLDTNGTHPEVLERLLADNLLDYAAMDIKSGRSRYAYVSGTPGLLLSRIEESVRLLMTGKIPFEFRTTVVRELHSDEDFLDIADWLAGTPRYFLQSYVDSEQVYERIFTPPSLEELERYQSILAPAMGEVSLRGI